MLRRLLPLLACIYLFAPARGWPQCRPGPLSVSNQYPLTSLHLSLAPRAATVCDAGSTRLSLNGIWSNTSIVEDQYTVDAESIDLTPALSYAAAQDLELSLALPLLWRVGGTLDSTIDRWHRVFGLPRGDRRKLEDNAVQIRGATKNGDIFAYEEEGFEFGNLKAGLKYAWAPEFAYLGELSLPTSSGTFGHSGVDLLNGLLYSRQFEQFIWYSGVAHVFVGEDESSGVSFERNHFEAFGGGEYRLGASYAVLANLSAQSKVLNNVASHPSYALYLDLGFRAAIGRSSWLDLGIRENPLPGDGTTDISFIAGLSTAY